MTLTHHDRRTVLRMTLWYALFAAALYLSIDVYMDNVTAAFAGAPLAAAELWRRELPAAALFTLSVFLLLMPGTSQRMRLFGLAYAVVGAGLLWWLVAPLG